MRSSYLAGSDLPASTVNALFYPFHLCHERTLRLLLTHYEQIHFRDYMALRLSPMMGTVAVSDRMGDDYPELLHTGQIVQGHSVSGAMSLDMMAAVDRDLRDPTWRSCFHERLRSNPQFQRGFVRPSDDQFFKFQGNDRSKFYGPVSTTVHRKDPQS